jgi:hypothetical protein
MREIISSLHGVDIRPQRRCGNTTRIIDNAIQIVYSGNICQFEDHHTKGNALDKIFTRFVDRLNYQDDGIIDLLDVDRIKHTVAIKE